MLARELPGWQPQLPPTATGDAVASATAIQFMQPEEERHYLELMGRFGEACGPIGELHRIARERKESR